MSLLESSFTDLGLQGRTRVYELTPEFCYFVDRNISFDLELTAKILSREGTAYYIEDHPAVRGVVIDNRYIENLEYPPNADTTNTIAMVAQTSVNIEGVEHETNLLVLNPANNQDLISRIGGIAGIGIDKDGKLLAYSFDDETQSWNAERFIAEDDLALEELPLPDLLMKPQRIFVESITAPSLILEELNV